MSTVLIFLVVIVVLVVAHELGHFFVAKAFKVRVDEFGVGYPPRAGKLFTWKGTLFTLNWLPFGGFVKIFGEEGETETSGAFAYQKMWKRVLIIAAGILANLLLAIILYAWSFGIGFLASPGDFPGSVPLGPSETLISSVVSNSPAEAAGLKAGDVITALGSGKTAAPVTSIDSVPDFIALNGITPMTMTVLDDGHPKSVQVTPKVGIVGVGPGIGISLAEVAPVRLPFFHAIGMGFTYTFEQLADTIHTLGALVAGIFRGNNALLSQVSGPVGIAEIAASAYALGFGSFLSFMALISVNLAVINLLPFPALDGGRLILELFSKKGRSRIPARVVSAVNQIGFLLLIVLMLLVTYHDIRHLVL